MHIIVHQIVEITANFELTVYSRIVKVVLLVIKTLVRVSSNFSSNFSSVKFLIYLV